MKHDIHLQSEFALTESKPKQHNMRLFKLLIILKVFWVLRIYIIISKAFKITNTDIVTLKFSGIFFKFKDNNSLFYLEQTQNK